ncbi:MAG: sodium:solute symporter [Planctomycetales bacterium]
MNIDQMIVLGYLIAVVAFGCWFVFYTRNADEFMSAGQSIPGWAMGLSIFGSYISTISFLGNPTDAYAKNWNPLVFALVTPVAAYFAVAFFVPFFRRSGEVSAYHHLEHRFGPWARTYCVVCFVMLQVVRLGMITQLLASVIAPLFKWDVTSMIFFLGVLITIYPLLGGTEGVIWAGVIQAIVLILGVIACVYYLIAGVPGGIPEIISVGLAAKDQGPWGKFSLGTFEFNLFVSSFWVVLLQGLNEHTRNFAIDQSYIQRYISAKSDKDAARSVWYGVVLYLPTAFLFFFMGASLFAYVKANPGWLPPDTPTKGVFPHFINTGLPAGLTGLVIAAIASAAMDSNLNCMATLFLKDIYQRYLRPDCSEKRAMWILHSSTFVFGAMSTLFAILTLKTPDILSTWWTWGGIASGGILGLFLLGVICPRTTSSQAAVGVVLGLLVTFWMTLSIPEVWDLLQIPPESALAKLRSPFHKLMAPFMGTLVIFVVGAFLGMIAPGPKRSHEPEKTLAA